MKLKLLVLSTILFLIPLAGCPTASTTTPPAALAPGYTSQFDEKAGQALGAAHALVSKAVLDYPTLSPTQQAAEKSVLNAFVIAVNTADSVYLAYHSGSATQSQVQTALNSVSTAQTNYTAAGVSK